ncbi:MAG: DUF3168 domain-containing protein [Pseudomonadota bacterium]
MEWDLQQAVYTALAADAGLAALNVAIHDVAPQSPDEGGGAGYPRISVGEMDVRDQGTKASDLFDVILRIHTYSASGSHREARRIQARLFAVLHRAKLPLAGHNLVSIRREASRLDRDPDDVRHGVCEFRILIEPL